MEGRDEGKQAGRKSGRQGESDTKGREVKTEGRDA
jgi:hypothetical protein